VLVPETCSAFSGPDWIVVGALEIPDQLIGKLTSELPGPFQAVLRVRAEVLYKTKKFLGLEEERLWVQDGQDVYREHDDLSGSFRNKSEIQLFYAEKN
jgi:hypothetical protein